jgi:hypothetical protein
MQLLTREPPVTATEPGADLLIKEARNRMRRRRLVVVLLTVSVVLAGATLVFRERGGAASTATHLSTQSRDADLPPTCSSRQLRLIDVGSPGDLAGHWQNLFNFANVSKSSCSLSGFPRMALYTVSGKFTNLRVGHFRSAPLYPGIGVTGKLRLPRVVLDPESGRASFWLTGVDVSVNNESCHSARKVQASPAGSNAMQSVSITGKNVLAWCGNRVSETPLVPGLTGSVPPRRLSYFFGKM